MTIHNDRVAFLMILIRPILLKFRVRFSLSTLIFLYRGEFAEQIDTKFSDITLKEVDIFGVYPSCM